MTVDVQEDPFFLDSKRSEFSICQLQFDIFLTIFLALNLTSDVSVTWCRYINTFWDLPIWLIENSDHLLTLNLPIFMIGNSLKLECEKLAGEKMEIQRHYVMVKKKKKNTKTCVCIDAWDSVANYRAAKGMSLGVLPDLRKKIPLALLHACLFFTTPRCIWNFLHV